MPAAPANEFQLFTLLVILLPGIVYEAVSTGMRGPSPTQRDGTGRVFGALVVSAALAVVYLPIVGPLAPPVLKQAREGTLSVAAWILVAIVGAVLLFGLPAAIAAGKHWWSTKSQGGPWLTWYDSTPSAWDFAFKRANGVFVRVMLKDGTFVGGWFGPESFAAGFPDEHELFLEDAYQLNEQGVFGDRTGDGVWISGTEIATLEIIGGQGDHEGDAPEHDDPRGGDRGSEHE